MFHISKEKSGKLPSSFLPLIYISEDNNDQGNSTEEYIDSEQMCYFHPVV